MPETVMMSANYMEPNQSYGRYYVGETLDGNITASKLLPSFLIRGVHVYFGDGEILYIAKVREIPDSFGEYEITDVKRCDEGALTGVFSDPNVPALLSGSVVSCDTRNLAFEPLWKPINPEEIIT
jgi:hypothetical protein